ncbi:transcriptional regulator [Mesorhizobium tianshanense]|uniref:DNA-binding HxlR family transcriptional regulator n=1 Tax=Mesorhizobium tianshanense TaxID=39844 RepID=A0A562MQ43_9HYPH|nr:metalloregulator ArsR/SmtB family transcription factor [Mesorhizobium tianshanense]TWI22043.1 DNA-binding HxlR family transcriptional regulator [Mesorhizobium tianshanense]GLS41984.1 transcriptional regulator [Mesorhizobium tianshanense]
MVSERLVANAGYVAEFLALIGSEKRLLMLIHLAEGELSVGDLAMRVGLSQSALSQHLARLLRLDIVARRRERQNVYYSCKSKLAREILDLLAGLVATDKLPSSRLQKYDEGARRFEAA